MNHRTRASELVSTPDPREQDTVESPRLNQAVYQQRRVRVLQARLAERDRLVEHLRSELTERFLHSTWLDGEVQRRETKIGTLVAELETQSAQLQHLQNELRERDRSAAVRFSRFLNKLTRVATIRPRKLVQQLRRRLVQLKRPFNHATSALSPSFPDPSPAPPGATTTELPKTEGPTGTTRRTHSDLIQFLRPEPDPYHRWITTLESEEAIPDPELLNPAHEAILSVPMTIAVVLDGVGASATALQRSLLSIINQAEPPTEIVVIGEPEAIGLVARDRIRLIASSPESKSEVLNQVISRLDADYVLFTNHQYLLPSTFVEHLLTSLNNQATAPAFLYVDEDEIDDDGRRRAPIFRSPWSPEQLLTDWYTGPLCLVDRLLAIEVGGIKEADPKIWLFDLVLRLSEASSDVKHLPGVFYHRQRIREYTSDRNFLEETDIDVDLGSQQKVVNAALERRGIDAEVIQPTWAIQQGQNRLALRFPDRGPHVAILIPTRDRLDLLRRCISSIRSRTDYENYRLIILDHQSVEPETRAYFDDVVKDPRIVVIPVGAKTSGFNYAAIHNEVIEHLEESVQYLLLLNNDTEVRTPGWLSTLVGYVQFPGVGAVGARLLYADGRIQHAGISRSLDARLPTHLHRGAPWWRTTEGSSSPRTTTNVDAITAACMLIRRDLFRELGGFDQVSFGVGYNDVDLCERIQKRGLRIVYAAEAELLHLEGASRGLTDSPIEASRYQDLWGDFPNRHQHPMVRVDSGEPVRPLRNHLRGLGRFRDLRPLLVVESDRRSDAIGMARQLHRYLTASHRLEVVLELPDRPDGLNPPDPSARVAELLERIDRDRINLVHGIGAGAFVAIKAAQEHSLPSLWSFREFIDFREAYQDLDQEHARVALQSGSDANLVLFPSGAVRSCFHPLASGWNAELIREVEPPIPAPEDSNTVFDDQETVGSIRSIAVIADEAGTIELVADALSLLIPDQRFKVSGFIPRFQFSPSTTETGDRRVVRFHSEPSFYKAIRHADAFLCIPGRDLFHRALSVALQSRVPTIATAIDGLNEYAPSGSTLLIDPELGLEPLRRTLRKILEMTKIESEQVERGASGISLLADPGAWLDRYFLHYQNCLKKATSQQPSA